jgi:hypothetical protein
MFHKLEKWRIAALDSALDHTKREEPVITRETRPSPGWRDAVVCGKPVRIYAEDGVPPWTIHGAVFESRFKGWEVGRWKSDGSSGWCHDYNLVQIKPTKRVFKTLNELAAEYSFSYAHPYVTVTIGDTVFRSSLEGDVKVVSDEQWLEIFTKEVNGYDRL